MFSLGVVKACLSMAHPNMVIVAQLVRALVCGTRGRGFESRLSPQILGVIIEPIALSIELL